MEEKLNSISKSLFGLLLLILVIELSACENDDGPQPDINNNKTTGFVVVGQTSNQSAVVKYIESFPEGEEINLSVGVKDFPRFLPNTVYDHSLFLPNPDDATGGFSKYVVNENGELVEGGLIPVVANNSFRIAVRNSESGVFHDIATPNRISVFNPATMSIIGTIDMSTGFVPDDVDQRYQLFCFHEDKVIAPIRGGDGTSFSSFIAHIGNMSNNSFVDYTQRIGNPGAEFQALFASQFGQTVTDGQGNTYILDGGDFTGSGTPAALNKIPAGSSSFDETYEFYPSQVLNPLNGLLPIANTFHAVGGTKGIAKVNADIPQEVINIVTEAGGPQNLSPTQLQQVQALLFSAETARWCELDLIAMTVTPISGIPSLGIFTGGNVFRHEGSFYLPVPTTSEQAYYKYDPQTAIAEKAFTIVGADLTGVFNLSENN
ncbi:MAG: hypothetical protein ACFCUU_04085 [Cyclobacteriaceae bacterium]